MHTTIGPHKLFEIFTIPLHNIGTLHCTAHCTAYCNSCQSAMYYFVFWLDGFVQKGRYQLAGNSQCWITPKELG